MNKKTIYGIETVFGIVSVVLFLLQPLHFPWLNALIFAVILFIAIKLIHRHFFLQYTSMKDRMAKIEKDLERFNLEAQVASSQVSSVSESLYITIDENNSFAQQVYSETKEMAELNGEVNDKIHDTISGIKNVIQLLEDASFTSSGLEKVSSESNEVIKSSLKEILDIVAIINGIQESSNGTLQYMEKLKQTSREIVHILETVRNVSKQTHLLALNASIESARAGEAGKGFAVVADEIRKLAVGTEEAVKDVNDLITHIQLEIGTVHTVAMENSSRVDNGVKATKSVEANLGKINTSFEDVLAMVKKIHALTQKETELTWEVEVKIESMEEIVAITTQRVEEVTESVHKQKHSIEDLADMGVKLNKAAKSLSELFEGSGTVKMSLEGTKAADKVLDGFKIINSLAGKKDIMSMDKITHRKLLSELVNQYEFIEAAWTNDAKGRFICSIPEAGIANGAVRDWFKQSIKGEQYVSPVYISAITKNPCITLSVPIRGEGGAVLGVIGVDLKL